MALTSRQVESNKLKPGRYADGGGLYLVVRPSGAKSWMLRFQLNKQRHDLGFGSFDKVPLADARDKRTAAQALIGRGINPKTKRVKSSVMPTFKEARQAYYAFRESKPKGWTNDKAVAQWESTLTKHADPVIGNKPIDLIDSDDIETLLISIWNETPETAQRLRGRIEMILQYHYARARHPLAGANPARWGGHMEFILGDNSVDVKHHAALTLEQTSSLMDDLSVSDKVASKALAFTIWTVCRTGDAVKAQWDEIDLDAAEWTISPERYKTRKTHIIPLSKQAIEMLRALPRLNEWVFPSDQTYRVGYPLSNGAMLRVLHRKGLKATVHGFRSVYREWADDVAEVPDDVSEHVLGHAVAGKAKKAYKRATMLTRRAEVMQDWANFLSGNV